VSRKDPPLAVYLGLLRSLSSPTGVYTVDVHSQTLPNRSYTPIHTQYYATSSTSSSRRCHFLLAFYTDLTHSVHRLRDYCSRSAKLHIFHISLVFLRIIRDHSWDTITSGSSSARRWHRLNLSLIIISARCNIYISRLCYYVSVRLSVRLSVCALAHYSYLGFKFRSKFTTHCGCSPQCARIRARSACRRIVVRRDAWREERRGHLALC